MADKDKNNFYDALDNLKQACLNGKLSPVYLFQGDETYFITQLSQYLEEHALPNEQKSFNQHILYGKDVNVQQIMNYAKRFPMMGSHQLVMVKEAQNLSGLDLMIPYLESPLESTILVLCMMGKKVNAATKEGKAFQKHSVFTAEKISDFNIKSWITQFVKTKGFEAGEEEIQMLVDHIGNNIERLDSELEKLKVNLGSRKKIEASDIETFIGISREYSVFELQKALGTKNSAAVSKILKHYSDDPGNNPFIFSLVMIFSFFQKLMALHQLSGKSDNEKMQAMKMGYYQYKEYQIALKNYPISKLKSVIETLHEMDLKSKGVGMRKPSDADLYKELIVKIIR